MVDFKLINTETNTVVNHFQLIHRLNLVVGDSGTGKSLMCDRISRLLNKVDEDTWNIICNVKVIMIDNINQLDIIIDSKVSNHLIIIDEDITEAIRKNVHKITYGKLKKLSNYFLILDRQSDVKFEVNVNAVFELDKPKIINNTAIYRTIKHFNTKDDNSSTDLSQIKDYKNIITEDKTSGKTFFKKVFPNKNVLDLPAEGNGAIVKAVNEEITKDGVIIALDYDCGAVAMEHIINKVYKFKNKNLAFIRMECFEEIICNSDFILNVFPEMKDKVINWQNYMSCMYKHTGKYFSELLHTYVKQKPPIETNSSRNIEKFYKKGAQYFKACFIDECCQFSINDTCKLYTINKENKLLNNKFESLNMLR